MACGGTLRQHIVGGPVEHEGALHPVTLAAGSRLRQLAGADTVEVSSAHHQSVDRLGAGLHAVGCAPDGCMEAIEHTSAGILAVQWHPEDEAATRGYDQEIFHDLLLRAREARPPAPGCRPRPDGPPPPPAQRAHRAATRRTRFGARRGAKVGSMTDCHVDLFSQCLCNFIGKYLVI